MVTPVEHAVQVSTALFLALLAAVVFAARPGHPLNRALGALLLLRGASDFFYEQMRVADTAARAIVAMRIANWFDWPTLLLTILFLQLAFPGKRVAARRALLAATGALTVALFFAFLYESSLFARSIAGQVAPYSDDRWIPGLFRVATLVLQASAVWLAARTARSTERSASERKQAALVGLAFALLLLDAAGRGGVISARMLLGSAPPPLPSLVATIASVALALALVPSLVRLADAFDGRARVVTRALLVAALAGGVAEPILNSLGSLPFAPLRTRFVWVSASAACLALALIRFGLAGLGERSRARAATGAHVALVVGLVALPAGALLVAQGGPSAALVSSILLLLSALTFSPGPRRALEGAVARLLLVDPSDTVAVGERARAYSAALAARSTAEGPPPARDPALVALRRELSLTDRDHAQLARLLAEQRAATAEPPLLGRYRVERELGRGAFGTALLATDVATGAQVVLKRFHASRVEDAALAEARAMAAVRHPRVVKLLSIERVADEVFLVIPFAEGGSAEDIVARGPLAPERAVALARDALDGLAAVHDAGLVHGDVKLPNVLIDAEGRAVLGDLGTARATARPAVDVTLTSSPVIGSLATLAPEALRGRRRSKEADVYAAGAALYRLLTGEHYVDLDDKDTVAATEAILYDAPRLPHPRVPSALEPILARALAKAPEERYASAAAMRAALDEAVAKGLSARVA